MTSSSLSLKNISMCDAKQVYINKLNLEIRPGEIVSLMGPSGSGKSTLLAYIAGFLSPHFTASGDVHIGKTNLLNLRAEQRRVGLLFQDDLLLPHLNVAQNLAFGIRTHDDEGSKRKKIDRMDMVGRALSSAGMQDFEERRPATLSGGQRARIALLRTLLSEPKALLLDEPFSKLDTELRQHFRNFVKDEVIKRDLPTLMVTHDIQDARAMNGPVLDLGREGFVRQINAE